MICFNQPTGLNYYMYTFKCSRDAGMNWSLSVQLNKDCLHKLSQRDNLIKDEIKNLCATRVLSLSGETRVKGPPSLRGGGSQEVACIRLLGRVVVVL